MLSRILFQKLNSRGHPTPPSKYKLQKDLNEARDPSIHTALKILPKAFTDITSFDHHDSAKRSLRFSLWFCYRWRCKLRKTRCFASDHVIHSSRASPHFLYLYPGYYCIFCFVLFLFLKSLFWKKTDCCFYSDSPIIKRQDTRWGSYFGLLSFIWTRKFL